MLEKFIEIPKNMKELGLAALSHANRIEPQTDKWAELSILQVAHAMEILIKTRIAEAHPLLIFDKLPPQKNNGEELSISMLSEKGHTIEWNSLLDKLWAVYDIKSIDINAFKEFGTIRNSIQHFGIPPANSAVSHLTSLQFIYNVIDPFINECWELFAIDFCQDFNPEIEENSKYWNYIRMYLLNNEIIFKVSPTLYAYKDMWWCGIKVNGEYVTNNERDFIEPIEVSVQYCNTMKEQLEAYEKSF